MSIPSVAIIGRPNVGKSSLLNAMARRRISIVEETAGVTRDRVSFFIKWREREFELVDTGGIGLVDQTVLMKHISSQIEVAMEAADLVLFVVDAKSGLTPMDTEVAGKVRRLGKPVILCVNKVENRRDEFEAEEAHSLGFGTPFPISAKEVIGITEVMDEILERLTFPEEDESEYGIKFAIVGKRNAGKSTLVNLLAGEERVIVSEIPGTTRDAVDVRFERNGKIMTAIDTAGLRKKTRVQDAIELFSLARSERSVRRADVVYLMFDMTGPISQVDKKLAAFVAQNFKPCIMLGNKLDLALEAGKNPAQWEAYIRQQLPLLHYAPIAFISAKEDANVEATLSLGEELHEQASRKIGTAELNKALQLALQQNAPHSKGKRPKLFYATQTEVNPPTILVFVNEPMLFTGQYDRYLQNWLRKSFDWKEIPLRLDYRKRDKVILDPE